MFIASVAVKDTSFSFDKLFSYVLPENLQSCAKVGAFVVVPFGRFNKKRQGVILKIEKKNLLKV